MILYYCLLGLIAGILNGLFGAGGGVAVVPLLKKAGLEPRKCHATSIAIILPLCVLSCFAYFKAGNLDINLALIYIPGGITGAILGAWLLKKINNNILRRIFGVIIIISSLRILFI